MSLPSFLLSLAREGLYPVNAILQLKQPNIEKAAEGSVGEAINLPTKWYMNLPLRVPISRLPQLQAALAGDNSNLSLPISTLPIPNVPTNPTFSTIKEGDVVAVDDIPTLVTRVLLRNQGFIGAATGSITNASRLKPATNLNMRIANDPVISRDELTASVFIRLEEVGK